MRTISATELKAWQDGQRNFQLIDIRELYEHEWSNLGGTSMPMGDILNHLDDIPRDEDVVMHCNSGQRAAALIDVLENKHGFTNLINLEGGIEAWATEIDATKAPFK